MSDRDHIAAAPMEAVQVGLLGGAFDPPHIGHIALAEAAARHFSVARLLVVVTGEAPHKGVPTPAEARYELAEVAFGGRPGIEVSRRELDRPGPSYTADTVRWAAERFGEVVFIVGADEFASFLNWHRPNAILEAARLGVATRAGYQRGVLDSVRSQLALPERVEFFVIPEIRVSSSQVRERVARGTAIDDLVPPAVAERIAARRLYRDP